MSSTLAPSQLRQKYLQYFADRKHVIIPSAALVPENDPTTLFTSSGMQPLITFLLGLPHPQGQRLVDSQKSFRSQDIEEVGDNRHTTFFEMLGNWSLGDYFKKEQLGWFFDFLTSVVGLDANKLFVTVFSGNDKLNIPRDDESVAIWKELFAQKNITATAIENADEKGMQGGRIFFYPEKKNWWSRAGIPDAMPAGEPGGPDSEVFYDFGTELGLHENSAFKHEPCHVNCDCGRFLEIGNSVFMQYQKQPDGSFIELPQKNVDFGGGFERILAALNNDPDVFLTDLFQPIIAKLEAAAGKKYADSEEVTRAYRVIADHMRAAVMLAADGVEPGSKAQGYFSRRLLRRAIRYASMIGMDSAKLPELVSVIADIYTDQYPEVGEKAEHIRSVIATEEQKFRKTLDKGLQELHKRASTDMVTGEYAFHLYETYGFPLELTQEEAAKLGLTISPQLADEFAGVQQVARQQSRTASSGMFKGGLQDHSEKTTQFHTATHLLHAALRQVLGKTVQQRGSNITAERLRFDFSHATAVTPAELAQVEKIVNDWIAADLPMTRAVMDKDAALASGALAFFGEKYPDQVSVYTVGKNPDTDWISKELCGGPHVTHTGEIGPIKIVKEKAAAAGVRRVYVESK